MTVATLQSRPVWVIGMSAAHALLSSIFAAVVALPLGIAYGTITGTIPPQWLWIPSGILFMGVGVWLSLALLKRFGSLSEIRGFAVISTALLIGGSILDISLDLLGLYREIPVFELVAACALSVVTFFLVTKHCSR